jgi:hypothetical protein
VPFFIFIGSNLIINSHFRFLQFFRIADSASGLNIRTGPFPEREEFAF